MIKIDIIAFKSGLFWYARCEIPPEGFDTYYYDNTPFQNRSLYDNAAFCWVDL